MAREFIIPKVGSTEFDTPVFFNEQERKIEPFGFLETFREMGWKNYNRAQYEAATRNFNIAMGIYNTDRRTVIGRGFSRSKNMLFEGALKDAETVLAMNDYDKEAIYLQALSQYELGNFEQGLLAFYKGINKRGRRPVFRDGRYQAEGTIEDAIGRYAGPMLTDMKGIVKKMEEKKERDRIKELNKNIYEDNLDIPPPHPCSDYEWVRYCRQQAQLDSVLAETYLGKLNSDRKWLEEALINPDVKSANKKGSEKLIRLTSKALDDMNKRQEILRSRKPFYHYKFILEKCEAGFRAQKVKLDAQKALFISSVTIRLLKKIRRERLFKNTAMAQFIIYRTKLFIDKSPKRLLPPKYKYLKELYNLAGLVYLDTRKFKPELPRRLNKKRIACLLGFDPIYNDEKIDPIVQESIFPFADYDMQMKNAEYLMEVANTDLERAWLFYEIGRCYGERQKWEYVVNRAKKCIACAKRADSLIWIINGFTMVAIAEMRDRNKDESIAAVKEGLEFAYKYEDEQVIQFLLACDEVLREKEVKEALVDTNTLLRKQQDYIINLISHPDLKDNAVDLFRRISTLPAKRKFSVMPGIIPFDPPGFSSGRLSIIPGGTGGRLSLHEFGKTTYKEFVQLD